MYSSCRGLLINMYFFKKEAVLLYHSNTGKMMKLKMDCGQGIIKNLSHVNNILSITEIFEVIAL